MNKRGIEKSDAIYNTKPVTLEEIEAIFAEVLKQPIDRVFFEITKVLSDPSTLLAKKDLRGWKVYAKANNCDVETSVSIEQVYNGMIIRVYENPIEEIPASGWVNALSQLRVTFYPAEMENDGDGYEYWERGIEIKIEGRFDIQSPFATWLFGLLPKLSEISSNYTPAINISFDRLAESCE